MLWSQVGVGDLSLDGPAGCLINNPAFHMAAVLLIALGMAVGLLGLLVMMTL